MNPKINYTLTLIALLLLTPLSALADSRSATEYECSRLDAERDGITCFLMEASYTPWLIIRLHSTPTTPKAKRERIDYLLDVLTHNYAARGGNYIQVRKRFVKKGNARYERMCYPDKITRAVNCDNWMPATSKWD
jgi:hypothetical protein